MTRRILSLASFFLFVAVFSTSAQTVYMQDTPADTEMEGLTYQRYGLDLGFFNKRVGEQRVDNGAYHNQAIIPPFTTTDTYINYSIRNHSMFNGTKIRLDATNLLNEHNITALALTGSPNTIYLNGGGTCSSPTASNPCDVFNTSGPTPISGSDQPTFIAGRSFAVTVTFGFAPRER